MDDEVITRKEFKELRELMEDVYESSEENNKILLRMQYIGRIAFWAKALLWTIVLILPFILIPIIAPYLKAFSIPGLTDPSSSAGLFGYPSPDQLKKALDTYKSGL